MNPMCDFCDATGGEAEAYRYPSGEYAQVQTNYPPEPVWFLCYDHKDVKPPTQKELNTPPKGL